MRSSSSRIELALASEVSRRIVAATRSLAGEASPAPLRSTLEGVKYSIPLRTRTAGAADGVHDCVERCGDDAGADTDAPDRITVDLGLDVRGRARIGSDPGRVLVVVEHPQRDAELFAERIDERVDRPVSLSGDW
jgi:hypothetical protein